MRMLFLCTNPRVEASMRFRLLQFVEPLRQAGHQVTVSTFFDESQGGYLRRIMSGVARRAGDLVRASNADRIVVHREIMPLSLNEYLHLLPKRAKLIFDFDDAVFLPRTGPGLRERIARPGSTRLLIERAALTYAGNEVLADYARQFSNNVRIMPTVLDTDRFEPAPRPLPARPVIGWVGSPATAPYLDLIMPALAEVAKQIPFSLKLVGAGRNFSVPNVQVENCTWRESEEVQAFQGFDIGVYPLLDDAWSRAKCGFKAIQYMACGVPFVVSPVGVISDMVRDGVDGLWARTSSEWVTQLTRLLRDEATRRQLIHNARSRAVERYSVTSVAPSWIRGIESLT